MTAPRCCICRSQDADIAELERDALSDRDLWLMVLCTVRYAMGRATYIVSDACGFVRQFRARIGPEHVEQIRQEVEQALRECRERGGWLGMEMDHREWVRLIEDLRPTAKEVA